MPASEATTQTQTHHAERPLRVAMIGLRGVPATYGGIERAVEELAAHLAGRGHDITVYARSAYSERGLTSHRGVRIKRLPQINTKHLEAASHTTLALLHALASRRFDVIHLHATGPGAMSAVPRLAGVPVVVTIQGLDWRREKWGRGARSVLRLASRLAVVSPDRAIVVSRELERYYREELDAATSYIPNGVDSQPPPHAETMMDLQAGSYVLFLGRLVPEKHVHTLIRAYRQVPGSAPLVIAGPGSHSPEYVEDLTRLAQEDGRVRMLGPRYGDEKAWLLHNAAAFVQPSSIEGLPIALLEALAAGCYPVVSSIPENLEPVTVEGDQLGASFPVGDEAALAEVLGAVLERTDRRATGERLSAHVRREYDWSIIAARTEALYRGIVDRTTAASV
ncbi:MAG TPA: glycosyltransferase family 4 protein [Solirubrobacteraceae bacterium]|jgi:glycosyltransferase involved in cell wall biosynthesis|nr:glycosyltransferase family 4 protein [Solirubrobacteraceae bacterium]